MTMNVANLATRPSLLDIFRYDKMPVPVMESNGMPPRWTRFSWLLQPLDVSIVDPRRPKEIIRACWIQTIDENTARIVETKASSEFISDDTPF